MDKFLLLNKGSRDGRVAELIKICAENSIPTFDFGDDAGAPKGRGIMFIEPRSAVDQKAAAKLPQGSYIFGYAKTADFGVAGAHKYICFGGDEKFVEENNRLTALAVEQILVKRFGAAEQKVLVVGWGKLAAQIEKVLVGADIHVLNFNPNKRGELCSKYGEKAYFERAPFGEFEIIINTVPKQLIAGADLRESGVTKKTAIYDLASAPFGFDLTAEDRERLDYNIEPALPGRYYPREAAAAVFDCIMRVIGDKDYVKNIAGAGKKDCNARADSKKTVVFCITGSSCNFAKVLPVLREFTGRFNVLPVISANAGLQNRFGDIEKFKSDVRVLCGNPIITTIAAAETLSANRAVAAVAVIPATGNTIAKLAHAVTDTCVTMAVKAVVRNAKPCVIGMATNDALMGNAANIGMLLCRKNYYFVPFGQDDPAGKPFSMVCDFDKAADTVEEALSGRQLQPILI